MVSGSSPVTVTDSRVPAGPGTGTPSEYLVASAKLASSMGCSLRRRSYCAAWPMLPSSPGECHCRVSELVVMESATTSRSPTAAGAVVSELPTVAMASLEMADRLPSSSATLRAK